MANHHYNDYYHLKSFHFSYHLVIYYPFIYLHSLHSLHSPSFSSFFILMLFISHALHFFFFLIRSNLYMFRPRFRFLTFIRQHSVLATNELGLSYKQPVPGPNDLVIVAMSSGVDSLVAAALYAKSHKNVKGIYMANWSQTARCTEAEWNEVQKISNLLGIESERVNFEKEYWNDVFQPMITMYQKGWTPNPDTGCNKEIKFGRLYSYCNEKYADSNWWLVTGHYARVMQHTETGESHLLRAYSKHKDQSYYLSLIPKSTLGRILMPIGHYHKPQIRELAQEFALPNAAKPDSQGLCFVSQEHKNFREFLNEYIPPNPGEIVTEDGKVWGKHQGLWHCTIGQKSTVLMPQGDPNYKGVWFVLEKNYDKNQLVIVRGRDNPKLFRSHLHVTNFEWMANWDKSCKIQLQYRSLQEPCEVKLVEIIGNALSIELETPARAMAPGQNVVLYQGNRVLGTGIIDEERVRDTV